MLAHVIAASVHSPPEPTHGFENKVLDITLAGRFSVGCPGPGFRSGCYIVCLVCEVPCLVIKLSHQL